MPRFTPEQHIAISSRGDNLLVSAAAGSGKTTVLVERVLNLALSGADVDSMLVVTFTRAAASGMREKLARALTERADKGDARCRDQLLRLERASITTIHAFCSAFLRDNFEAADVDPKFTVMDEADADIMREGALDAALELAYEKMSPEMSALDYGRGSGGVKELARELMRFLDSRPDPDIWLERALAGDISAWKRELALAARRAVAEALICVRQALMLELPEHYIGALVIDAAELERISEIEDYEQLRAAVADFKLVVPRGRKGEYSEDAIEEAKSLRKSASDMIKKLAIADLPLELAARDSMDTLKSARALAEIALEARRIEDEMKAERSQLMYADLEARTYRALANPEIAESARERYEYVFVDEYQDTSAIQEAIISRLSREGRLFMVGDVKQSIYRFRQAEPRLFLKKYAEYTGGAGGKMLPLTRNFRTAPATLDFVNAVFERLMTGGDTDILYDDVARLRPGADDMPPGAMPEIHIIEGATDDDLQKAQREGLLIARLIKRLMAEDESLKYSDFAVITRQGARAFDAIEPMLLAEGIPAVSERGGALFSTTEVTLALTYLKLIDNFRSDIELVGALRSCMCSLSIEELAQIRLNQREGAFSDAVLTYAALDNALGAKLRAFLDALATWRLCAGAESLGELARRVVNESALYAWAGALPGGEARQRNLDALIARAADYDRDVSGSLNRFLTLAEAMRDKGDSSAPIGLAGDAVRLMTAHHSKGLEFTVVIGALLGTRLIRRRNEDKLACHAELGLGLMKFDEELRTRRLTLSRAAISERLNREDMAEELRVLYVMATRAKKRLLLVGTVNSAERAERRWRAATRAPAANPTFLDMIISALDSRAQVFRADDSRVCGCAADMRERAGEFVDRNRREQAPALREFAGNAEEFPADLRARAGEFVDRNRREQAPALREFAGNAEEFPADLRARAAIFIHNARDITEQPSADMPVITRAAPVAPPDFDWRYPYPDISDYPLKLTASGLLRGLEGPTAIETPVPRPDFLRERGMTASERGTACHLAIQLIDVRALGDLSGAALEREIFRQLNVIYDKKLMDDEQYDAVSPKILARFFDGNAGRRMRAASDMRRELSFILMLDIKEALIAGEPGEGGEGELLVQGTIDCCFIENGQWVILDYKTGYADDPEQAVALYARQLALYARALEKITGVGVREKILCLLSIGREFSI